MEEGSEEEDAQIRVHVKYKIQIKREKGYPKKKTKPNLGTTTSKKKKKKKKHNEIREGMELFSTRRSWCDEEAYAP